MAKRFDRRKFLLYSSATLSSSLFLKASPTPGFATAVSPPATGSKNTIAVGILHSLSGAMASVETSLIDAEKLAIEEINQAGGVLGKQIKAVVEDGASYWTTFTEKANKLIDRDKVVTVFGCYTSASRKSVLPVFESKNHLLWYPVYYEGQECSKNIFYTGATPNQHLEIAVDWVLANKGKQFFLVGSDSVFPRTVNAIIKAKLAERKGEVLGEDYLFLGDTEVAQIITKIKSALPQGGIIFNSLNGNSNAAFFKQLHEAGMTPEKYPSVSVNISEEEVKAIGVKYLKGHYAVGNYFMTVKSPENSKFVSSFKAKYGKARVINNSMEAAYIMVYLWKQSVEKAGVADDLDRVRMAALGQSFDAPGGKVTLENNHHLSKFVRIGQVREDGLFDLVFATPEAVKPVPWNQFLEETKGFACDWSDPAKGGKFKVRSQLGRKDN